MLSKLFSLFNKKKDIKSYIPYPYFYKNEFGIKFYIENEIVEYRTKFYGHERDFVLKLYSQIRSDDVFYDIGSSVGLISMFASKKIDSGGHIISFEPDPQNLNVLKKNFELNKFKNFIIKPIALGEEKAKLKLYTNGSNDKSPSLAKVNNIDKFIEVEVNTIDNLIELGLIPPTIVKIDVEGAEFLVLKGMAKLLDSEQAPRLLIVEIHPDFLIEFNTNETEIFDFIEKFNYITLEKEARDNQILCSFKKK